MVDDCGAEGNICWRLSRVPSRRHSACAPRLWRRTTGSNQSGRERGDGSASILAPPSPTINYQTVGPILPHPGHDETSMRLAAAHAMGATTDERCAAPQSVNTLHGSTTGYNPSEGMMACRSC